MTQSQAVTIPSQAASRFFVTGAARNEKTFIHEGDIGTVLEALETIYKSGGEYQAIIGGYDTKAEAEEALATIRRCVQASIDHDARNHPYSD